MDKFLKNHPILAAIEILILIACYIPIAIGMRDFSLASIFSADLLESGLILLLLFVLSVPLIVVIIIHTIFSLFMSEKDIVEEHGNTPK